MKFVEHPLWLVGFRPFFALACIAGMVFPVLWVTILSGKLSSPPMPFSIIQWHAHEMLFGFGWAVLGGFLLTSTKNWVNIRGYHGYALIWLSFLWMIERLGMWFSGELSPIVFWLTNNLFLGSMIVLLLGTLIIYRNNDSYRAGNWAFIIILPAFLIAKHLMLSDTHFAAGSSFAIGLFRVAFLVMLERTLTQFMKNSFQVSILHNNFLDRSIIFLALTFVFEAFLPPSLAAIVALVLGTLLLVRLAFWYPKLAMRRLDLGIMYLGYSAIVVQLLIESAAFFTPAAWVGSVSVHVFAFGAMGLIIPAMLTRICNGHTGRKVIFGWLDKLALWIMMFAFVVRIVLTQIDPENYLLWLDIAAICWFSAFALIAWRYVPFLLAARVDGREH